MEPITFLIILTLFVVFSFFIVSIITKIFNKRIETQKRFLFVVSERAKNLLDQHGYDEAMHFIKRNAEIIFTLHEDAFDKKFKDVEKFIYHIGDDYTEEENINILLAGKYREEDIDKFAREFISLVYK